MDSDASKLIFERSIQRLKDNAIFYGSDEKEIIIDGWILFIPLRKKNAQREYMLKIEVTDSYPAIPANYRFVNSEDMQQGDIAYWPSDGGRGFKHENPPWICVKGTKDWVDHGHPNPGAEINLIEKVVFSIFSKIEKYD